AGGEHDQVGRNDLAALHPGAFGRERLDIRKLLQRDLALDQEIGAADIEIIAAAPRKIFELPAGIVLAEIELEADLAQPLEQLGIERLRLVASQRMALARE